MKLSEIINSLNLGNISVICFLVLSLVEISPIKINPWSWLCRVLAKYIGITDIKSELVEMRENVDELDYKIDHLKVEEEEKRELHEALATRRRILRFNDELLQSMRHSQEMFNDVLDDITDYDNYCNMHPNFVNQRAVLAESNIKTQYQKCVEQHDFL
jgi:hypothetical protein